jgi:hypothetical protein
MYARVEADKKDGEMYFAGEESGQYKYESNVSCILAVRGWELMSHDFYIMILHILS